MHTYCLTANICFEPVREKKQLSYEGCDVSLRAKIIKQDWFWNLALVLLKDFVNYCILLLMASAHVHRDSIISSDYTTKIVSQFTHRTLILVPSLVSHDVSQN